jgi:hypothetical protein
MICKQIDSVEPTTNYSSDLLSPTEVLDVVDDVLKHFQIAGVIHTNDFRSRSKRRVVAGFEFSKTLNLPQKEMIVAARTSCVGTRTVLHIECAVPDDSCEHPTIGTVITLLGKSIYERLELSKQERERQRQQNYRRNCVSY